ncbi:DUF309 domain-containing protein [Sulfurimonas xiamenensis]|jgi:hypothetical protein|uniref:DUF309 domain-containing protein n=1 Tax=Sulfurimonas xiamenensis TaxID=2590021 RepID=A0AAJ4A290_9BACT|nr:DUF309 domain-containing protein [Sulfurimonas xiamenensis]PLY14931.1 MAG: DUF309 domain-containing protein [Sulfurimonas sp.]QFR42425.1 DUF309 domain-containing protein [Sulfurimonas xiamenensis]
MSRHKKQLESFIKNLRSENFYNAHEDLEVLWFERRFEDSDEVRLLKGFINASVCFELHKKNRIEASKKVWNNYLKYRDLIEHINSPYVEKYRLIIDEIEKIKKSFIK